MKKTVHIIGLGNTAKQFKPDGNTTIGVNDVKGCDYQVCVDRPQVFTLRRYTDICNLKPKAFFTHLDEWKEQKGFIRINLKNINAHNGRWKDFIPSSNNSPFVACGVAFHLLGANEIKLWGVDFNDHPNIKEELREQAIKDYALLNRKLNGMIKAHPDSYLFGRI